MVSNRKTVTGGWSAEKGVPGAIGSFFFGCAVTGMPGLVTTVVKRSGTGNVAKEICGNGVCEEQMSSAQQC